MKTKMKKYEKLAIDYATKTFPKGGEWAENCVATNAYMNGYKQALEDVQKCIDIDPPGQHFYITHVGSEEVEVEFKDGSHQLVGKKHE